MVSFQDTIAIEPSALYVLNVVIDHKLISSINKLPVANIREEIRLHDGYCLHLVTSVPLVLTRLGFQDFVVLGDYGVCCRSASIFCSQLL